MHRAFVHGVAGTRAAFGRGRSTRVGAQGRRCGDERGGLADQPRANEHGEMLPYRPHRLPVYHLRPTPTPLQHADRVSVGYDHPLQANGGVERLKPGARVEVTRESPRTVSDPNDNGYLNSCR
jgi:hypothetical protein